jgi:hypothetical protein
MFVPTKVDGVPKFGVTSVGLLLNTTLPEPVEEVTPVPPFATGRVPVTPVVIGRPVQLVSVPEAGVPKTGVTKVGLVERTTLPDPVDVVTPVPPLATGRVPVTPVVIGRPVQLVNVPDVGVPKTGVTSVGLVDKTLFPDPVDVVTPVPPFNTGKVPVTPVVIGRPVQLVKVPEVGVPRTGVTRVGVFASTTPPVPVDAVVEPVPPLATGRVPVTPVVKGSPVALVNTAADGVPRAGVVSVGLDARTTAPVPVAVVTPVPPDVTGNAFTKAALVAAKVVARTEVEYIEALVIFVPSLYTIAEKPAGRATPVPVEFLIVIVSAQSFCTMYCFSIAGTIKSLAPPEVPVRRSLRLRAV